MKEFKSLLFALLFISCSFISHAQPGENDLTFNTSDLGYSNGSGAPSVVYAAAIQPDGKSIIGGSFFNYNGTTRGKIARINTDGTVDSTFNPGTGANNSIWALAIQADGKVLIAGQFTSFNGVSTDHIARLNVDGSLDTAFSPINGANDDVWTISIQPDGKILMGGDFTFYNGTARKKVARLNTDGTLDMSFDPGSGANDNVWSSNVQADGKIIIGGKFTTFDGSNRSRIARLNADGSLDTSFDPGTGLNNIPYTIAIQTDNKIVLGGSFTSFDGTTANRLVRLNSNGSLDAGFNSGTEANSNVRATILQSDGKIIIGGNFTTYNGTGRNHIARLNTDGTLDTTFDPGQGTDEVVYATPLQSDGKIILGGDFTTCDSTLRNRVARLNSDGSHDRTFNPGRGANAIVLVSAIQLDGKIIIGGQFTTYEDTWRNRIARLNVDGTLDSTFNPGIAANNTVETISVQTDGKIIIGGAFTSFDGTTINRIARLLPNGSLDTTFSLGTGANGAVNGTSIQANGKIIIGGAFTSYDGTAINRIARINADGSIDPSFNPGTGPGSTLNSVEVQADGKIVISGFFTSYNGTTRNRVARINADGTLDMTFNSSIGASNTVYTASVQSNGQVVIGGLFTSYGGTSSNRIARINTDGTLDATFNLGTGLNNTAYSTAVQGDGKIIVGGQFTSYDGTTTNRIVRLNVDGSIDTTFNIGTGASSPVWTTSLQTDGKIIVGGHFTSYNGIGRNRITRLFGCDSSTGMQILTECHGFSITIGTNTYDSTGIYIDTIMNVAGCDSILTTNLTIYPALTGSVNSTICHEDSVVVNGTTYNAANPSGTEVFSNIGPNNCDSIVTVSLSVLSPVVGVDIHTKCDSLTWIDGNTYMANNNTATFNIPNGAANGCDSLVTLDLTISNTTTGTDTRTECDSLTWIDGNTYTSNNNNATFNIINGSANGCDSLVSLDLTIINTTTGTDTRTECDSLTWIDGNTYTADNNSATFNIINGAANGCDSLVSLDLTIINTTTGTDMRTECDSLTWIDGNTYTADNNNATFNIINGAANGCDSLVSLDLTIINTATGTDTRTECDSLTWIDGNTYTADNNTATFNIINGATNGCDSLVSLDLTIINTATETDTRTECDSITWIDGNTYTTNNNTATFNIIGGAANGCDSLVYLDLTIINSVNETDVRTACNSLTWIDGNTYTSNNNTATFTIPNGAANGCDSIITLDLTVITIDSSVTNNNDTLSANQSSASYQWIDCGNGDTIITNATNQNYGVSISGNYAVIISIGTCTDTSACFNVTISGVDEHSFNNEFSIYPNPSKNQLIISFDEKIDNSYTISLRNTVGQLIQELKPSDQKISLDISHLQSGVYLATVSNSSGSKTVRIIKQ